MVGFSRIRRWGKCEAEEKEKRNTSFSNFRKSLMVFTKVANFFLTEGLISDILQSAIPSTSLSCESSNFFACVAISSSDWNLLSRVESRWDEITNLITCSTGRYFNCPNKGRIKAWIVNELKVRQDIFDLCSWLVNCDRQPSGPILTSILSKNLRPPRSLHGIPCLCNALSIERERALNRTGKKCVRNN